MDERSWAVGIFEGEGTIVWNTRSQSPVLRMAMTDEDVVRHFHSAVGVGVINGPYVQKSKPKMTPIWYWGVSNFADVCELMEWMTPGLGQRRNAKWAELKQKYYDAPVKRRPLAKRTRESMRKLQEV